MDSVDSLIQDSLVVSTDDLKLLKGITTWENVVALVVASCAEIIFLSETCLTDFIPDSLIHIDGYSLLRLDRNLSLWKTRDAGLVVYIKELINACCVDDLCIAEKHIEALTIKVDLKYTRDI